MEKIPSKQMSFIKINPRGDEEVYDGLIKWRDNIFYFRFENDFDNGNRYLIYDKNNPIAYFSILTTDDDFSEEDIYIGDIHI